ncbi:MAG: tetratricopeptide repeat protein [Ignavibacteria bacterium]
MTKPREQKKDSTLFFYIILAVITFALYANSLSNEFVFDDESVVMGDESLTKLSNIPKYFTGEQGFHKVIGRYYRPVVSASYNIDFALWGLKPFGFHLTNVLIHVINVLLFLRLLLLMFSGSVSKFKNYGILIGAVLFALHPIHTEAVAWVSGRTDSLSCTFFFASFIYYFKYSSNENNRNLILTLLFYLLALLSKEMAITLPVVIILYDLVINKQSIRSAFKEKLKIYSAFIILSVLYFILRWVVLKDVPQRESYFYFYGKDLATAFFTMLQTIPIYFKLAVFPYGMLYHYGGYLPYVSSPFEATVIFSIIFLLIIGFAAFYLFKRMPFVSYSILFFFITLLPVMNIIPTMNFMADRFLYIPSAFLSFAVIAVILKYYTPQKSGLVITVSAVVLIAFGAMTISRNADWKTNDILFMSCDGKPGSVLYVNIGNIYANKGDYRKAEVYYRKAIELRIGSVLANNNLGKLFLISGNYDSAYYYMHQGYLLDTLSPEPMHSMALLNAKFEKLPEAILWLEKIQSVAPNYMNSLQMLEELKARQKMGSVNPNSNTNADPDVMNKTAELEKSSYEHYQKKEYDAAIKELEELIKLSPSMASGYYNNIGMCYMDNGKFSEAIESFGMSVKENPKFSSGYNNLGTCYEKLGDISKAKDNYKKAVEADPNNQSAKQNLEKLK